MYAEAARQMDQKSLFRVIVAGESRRHETRIFHFRANPQFDFNFNRKRFAFVNSPEFTCSRKGIPRKTGPHIHPGRSFPGRFARLLRSPASIGGEKASSYLLFLSAIAVGVNIEISDDNFDRVFDHAIESNRHRRVISTIVEENVDFSHHLREGG